MYAIYADILHICKEGKLISHVVGRAGLNFKNMPRHIRTLKTNELIVIIEQYGHPMLYKTTDKGLQYIETYNELKKFVPNKPVIRTPS